MRSHLDACTRSTTSRVKCFFFFFVLTKTKKAIACDQLYKMCIPLPLELLSDTVTVLHLRELLILEEKSRWYLCRSHSYTTLQKLQDRLLDSELSEKPDSAYIFPLLTLR